jgi:hypothetical protein
MQIFWRSRWETSMNCWDKIQPLCLSWSWKPLICSLKKSAKHDARSLCCAVIQYRKHLPRATMSARSRSHITTDGQSVSSSWCLAPSGAGEQMLHLFEWQLLSLFSCRAPLWREDGSVICSAMTSSISSYTATDGLSASSSWCRALNWAHNQVLISLFGSYFVFSV